MTVTRYVNTNSAGGDGTTRALSGSTAAFASLAAAEAALQGTLSEDLEILCSGGADGPCTIYGWSTSAGARLIIKGDPSATAGDGKNDGYAFDTGYYYIDTTTTALDIRTDFVTVDGLQFQQSATTSNTLLIKSYGLTSSANVVIKNCKFNRNADGYLAQAIATGPGTWSVYCNLFNWTRAGDQFRDTAIVTSDIATIYNNTIGTDANQTDTNDPAGITVSSGSVVTAFNNAIFVNGGDCIKNSGTLTASYNAADQDDDSSGHQDISPSGSYSTDMNAAFSSWGTSGNDWSIKDTSSVLYDNGTTGGPSTDQNGVTFSTQDIGCFAFVPAGGSGGGSIPFVLLNSGIALVA